MMLCVAVAALLSLAAAAHASPASPGDFLVIDPASGTGGAGALFTVDPVTGSRTTLSDFGNPVQGPIGPETGDLVLGASGTILVTDIHAGTGGNGALFTVDPATGNRTILSDFGDITQGPIGVDTQGIAQDASGTILVTDHIGLLLFTVDPATGNRTVLSDFGDVTQGPTAVAPVGIAVGPSGTILVTDISGGTGGHGALFTVDPVTGAREILSDFGDFTQGPLGGHPLGIAVNASGTILVIDFAAGTGGRGALFTVDAATGAREILSDFGDGTQGPTGGAPGGLTLEASGIILVTDALVRALFTVDPTTGSRTIVSDFNNPIKGPTGLSPLAVVVFGGGTSGGTSPDTTITEAVMGKGKPVANGAKTSSTSVQFTFAGTDDAGVSGFECSLDGAVFSPCSSPTSYINLAGGAHTFQVKAVDTSGNKDSSPATFSWSISGKGKK